MRQAVKSDQWSVISISLPTAYCLLFRLLRLGVSGGGS